MAMDLWNLWNIAMDPMDLWNTWSGKFRSFYTDLFHQASQASQAPLQQLGHRALHREVGSHLGHRAVKSIGFFSAKNREMARSQKWSKTKT